MLLTATALNKNEPKYETRCKSCSLKYPVKFWQKCCWNRTASFALQCYAGTFAHCTNWSVKGGSVTHQKAVPVPSISCCVLNHHNLFYQIQNALPFNRDTCCHLAHCLQLLPLLPFHWLKASSLKTVAVVDSFAAVSPPFFDVNDAQEGAVGESDVWPQVRAPKVADDDL